MATTRYNPVELLKAWGLPHEHVTFNPKLAGAGARILFAERRSTGEMWIFEFAMLEVLTKLSKADPVEAGWFRVRTSRTEGSLPVRTLFVVRVRGR